MKLVANISMMILVVMMSITAKAGNNPEWVNLTSAQEITTMAEANGTLWVGYKGGLTAIDLQTGEKEYFNMGNSGLPSTQVEAVAIAPNGDIWIGTYDQGLVMFDGTDWTVYNTTNSDLSAHQIYTIQFDQDGVLWIGALLNLISFAPYGSQNFTDYPIPGYTAATSLLINSPTDIITGWDVHNTPLYHFNGTGLDTFATPPNGVYCLKKDGQGTVWAGYDGGIMKYLGNGAWEQYDSASGVTGGVVRDMLWMNGTMYICTDNHVLKKTGVNQWVDAGLQTSGNRLFLHDNDLYIGTLTEGLFKTTDGLTLETVKVAKSNVPFNTFRDAIRLSNDKLLLSPGSNKPLVTFDGNNWELDSSTDTLYGNGMIRQAPDGSVWMLSYRNLYHLENGAVETWPLDSFGVPSYGYNCLEVAPDGRVFMGTFNDGFVVFDGAGFDHYQRDTMPGVPTNASIHSNKVHGFAFKDGLVYIATYVENILSTPTGGGLEVWDGSTFTNYNESNSNIVSHYISELEIMGDAVIAGGDNGFSVFENGTFTNYGFSYGNAPFAYLRLLELDNNGDLWISGVDMNSDDMLVKWSNGQVVAIFDSSNAPGTVMGYGLNDMTFDKDNNLWLLHSSGTYIYKEGGVVGVEDSLNVGIEDVLLLGVSIYPNPAGETITVKVAETGSFELHVYDLSGRLVKAESIDGTQQINIADLQPGYLIYQLTDRESGQTLRRGKLLKL